MRRPPLALLLIALSLTALLAACGGPAPATLKYGGHPEPVPAARGRIAGVSVVDERGVPERTIGAVTGWDGKPLKVLTLDTPAADAVARAFRDALAARGELAPGGLALDGLAPYTLQVTLLQLHAEQDAVRSGFADMQVRLIDRATGREAYSARVATEQRGDDFVGYGGDIFGSPSALNAVANATLDRAIDRALDKEGFVTALR